MNWRSCFLISCALLAPAAALAQSKNFNAVRGILAGSRADSPKDLGGNTVSTFYGTDLGLPTVTSYGLFFNFGDTWKNTNAIPIGCSGSTQSACPGQFSDDTVGMLSLASPGYSTTNPTGGFPDGNSIENWLVAHQNATYQWKTKLPVMTVNSDVIGGVRHPRRSEVFSGHGAGSYAAGTIGSYLYPDELYSTLDTVASGLSLYRYPTGLGATPLSAYGIANYPYPFVTHQRAETIHYRKDMLTNSGAACTTATCCGNGFTLDTNMGTCGGTWLTDLQDPNYVPAYTTPSTRGQPCIMGTTNCGDGLSCAKPPHRGSTSGTIAGLCVDNTSPYYESTTDGRLRSVAYRQLAGYLNTSSTWQYYVWPFNTHKFRNSAMHLAKDFSPDRAYNSASNLWEAPATSATTNRALMWGRPGYAGFGKGYTGSGTARSAKLYFAYADSFVNVTGGNAAFKSTFAGTQSEGLRYFSGYGSATNCTTGVATPGTTNKYPCFSAKETEARALNLSSTSGDATKEEIDVTYHFSVTYAKGGLGIPGKFVMIYGGSILDSLRVAFGGVPGGVNAARQLNRGTGSLYARFADYPWGPWTAPVALDPSSDQARTGDWNYALKMRNVSSATGGGTRGTATGAGQYSAIYSPTRKSLKFTSTSQTKVNFFGIDLPYFNVPGGTNVGSFAVGDDVIVTGNGFPACPYANMSLHDSFTIAGITSTQITLNYTRIPSTADYNNVLFTPQWEWLQWNGSAATCQLELRTTRPAVTCDTTQQSCLTSEALYGVTNELGFPSYAQFGDVTVGYYGAGIAPNWTRFKNGATWGKTCTTAPCVTQVYYLVSTWNPYQVLLMQAEFRP